MKHSIDQVFLKLTNAGRASVFAAFFLCVGAGTVLADRVDFRGAFIETPAPGEMAELEELANEGDAAAQFLVGSMYVTGWGVKRDLVLGTDLIRKAADQGNSKAQGMLGAMYDFGHGVATDREKAANWYLKAARQGLPQAQFNLAALYESKGGHKNYVAAARWYRAAAETGMTPAQVNLGILYFQGLGVARNLLETYKWWSIAARLGDAAAANGASELAGRIRLEDLEKAHQWIEAWQPKPSMPYE